MDLFNVGLVTMLKPFFQIRNNKKTAILVKEVNPKKKLFLVYRPNTGKQLKLETCADLKKKYKKVTIKIMLVSNFCFLFFSHVCIQLCQIRVMDYFCIAWFCKYSYMLSVLLYLKLSEYK